MCDTKLDRIVNVARLLYDIVSGG